MTEASGEGRGSEGGCRPRRMRGRARKLALAMLCTAVGVLALAGAPAQAASARRVIGSFGTGPAGPGSFVSVTGIAVEQSSHDVYVYDSGDGGAVFKFNAAGEPQKFSSLPANVIEGVGGYSPGESEIAVDGSSGPDKGDIYVANGGEVEIYASTGARLGTLTTEGSPIGVAVDPSGDVYVAFYGYEAIKKYTPTANPVTEADYTSSLSGVGEVSTIAVDSAGDVYVATFYGPVTKYAASEFNTVGVPAFGTVIDPKGATLAVDPSSGGDVYIDEGSDIAEYNPSGSRVESFGTLSESFGVAESHESGDVYASAARENSEVNIYGPLAVYPTVAVGSVSDLHDTSVTLNGTVNPEGTSVTACLFEYGTTTNYGQSAPCVPAASPTNPLTGNSSTAVSASVAGLQSGTKYYFRLAATNANGSEEAADTFETLGPRIDAESVAIISSTSEELLAQIDPRGADTSYYFQYGTASCAASPSSCTDVPAPPGVDIHNGTTDQSVAQQVQGLAPGTYHYRVVAVQGSEVLPGVEHTFTTLPASVTGLLDGRAWEMVSPLDKDGAEPGGLTEIGAADQASEAGGAVTYISSGPIPAEGEAEGNLAPKASQVLSVRDGVDGWVSQNLTTPTNRPSGFQAGHGPYYRIFSSDLALGLVKPVTGGKKLAEPPLSPALSPGEVQEKTLSLRDDAPLAPEASEAGSYAAAKRNGELMGNAGFLALVDAQNAPGIATAEVEVYGATTNLAHGVFGVAENSDGTENDLDEWSPGGELAPVSVLPGQTSEVIGALGGGASEEMTRHAISNNGALVFWTRDEGGTENNLYVRDTETSETGQLDTVQGGSGSGVEHPYFWTASAEGSRVFFTDEQQLTAGSGAAAGKADLYESEVTGGAGEPLLVGKPIDLAPGGEVQGVLGASEDGSYVYFVADGVLGDGAERGATQGTSSLYEYHRGATTFIATLSQEDIQTWGRAIIEGQLTDMTSRVSPDGQYLAFMSDRPLTGYDNLDANSGIADEEVFLYEASGEGHLVCASCNPSGERPEGVEDTGVAGHGGEVLPEKSWLNRWLAGSVPSWTADYLERSLYQSRYLSNSGRLFFNSPDRLVPLATSAMEKVYEYEPSGVGSCESGSGAGCVGLVSSGDSEYEAEFLDASASGGDVFFLTADRLVPQDTDSAYDVYDAHECTSSSPCPPPAGAVPPACTTAESCRAAPAPQPEIFGAPPSQTFSGAGNLTPVTAAVSPKPVKKKTAAQVRAEKLTKALKACKKQAKAKRKGCEAAARKRYGAKAKKKSKTKAKAKKSTKKSNGRGN